MRKVPREIEISNDGYVYKVPILCEAPVTVRKLEKRREDEDLEPLGNEVVFFSSAEKPTGFTLQHMGTSTVTALLNWEAREKN